MLNCPACNQEIPHDSRFCGLCGFRLQAISKQNHKKLSETIQAIVSTEEPIPLTQAKNKPVSPQNIALKSSSSAETLEPTAELSGSRSHQRFPLKVEVNYTSEHNFYTGFCENLSEGGIFIATHALMSIGDFVEINFTVPGINHTCVGVCKVQWIRDYNQNSTDTVPGMGLRFCRLDAEARAAIELFIQHREPIFYDAD